MEDHGRDIPTFDVADEQGLIELVEAIRAAQPDKCLFFRGQTHEFYPSPSASRPHASERLAVAAPYIGCIWDTLTSLILLPSRTALGPGARVAAPMALLQHYGFRSWFVDVTSDLGVAMWFAHWRYVEDVRLVSPTLGRHCRDHHSDLRPLDHAAAAARFARHEPADGPGTIWVFAVPDDHVRLLRLLDFMPGEATRVHRQSGAGLLQDDDGTFASTLVAKVTTRIAPADVQSDGLGRHLNTEFLFPPPSEDPVYNALLSIPSVVSEHDLGGQLLVATDPLDVPVYMAPESDAFWAYVNQLQILLGLYGPVLHKDAAGVDVSVVMLPFTPPGGPRSLLGLKDYLDSLRSDEGSSGEPVDTELASLTHEDLLVAWPDSRLYLQVPAFRSHELAAALGRGGAYPVLRGYFVEILEREVIIRETVEDLDYVREGEAFRYRLPWDVDASRGMQQDERRVRALLAGYWLQTSTHHLRRGGAFLTRLDSGHFNLNWAQREGAIEPLGDRWADR